MVQWTVPGTQRCEGLESFDINTGQFVGRVNAEHPHSDLTVLTDGQTEVYVSVPSGGVPNGASYVSGVPMDNNLDFSYPTLAYWELPGPATGEGQPKYLYLTDTIFEHISCRGPFGWCLVTSYPNMLNGGRDPLEDELFLIKLDGSKVVRLAHHHSSGDHYYAQPRASFSADGRYVVFDTDWDAPADETVAMLIDLAIVPSR